MSNTTLANQQHNPQLREILKLGRREVVNYYVNKWAEIENERADSLQARLDRLEERREQAKEALREALTSRYHDRSAAWAASVERLKGMKLTLEVKARWADYKEPTAFLSAELEPDRDLGYRENRGLELNWAVPFSDLPKKFRSRLDSLQAMKVEIKNLKTEVLIARVTSEDKKERRRELNEHMVARILEETQEGKDFLLALKGLQTTQVGRFLPTLAGGAQ